METVMTSQKKALLMVAMAALALAVSDAALAQRGHGYRGGGHARLGVYVGVPLGLGLAGGYWGPNYYYPPYYAPYYSPYNYPPAVMAAPVSPPTYVEQAAPAAPAPQPGYWYYCAQSGAYYPYVNQCAGAWQRVSPQPPAG
jgi:hypothetical protein